MKKSYLENKLAHFLPENANKSIDVGSIVYHVDYPDLTIGLVTKIEFETCGEFYKNLYKEEWKTHMPNEDSEPRKARNYYEVKWSSSPPIYLLRRSLINFSFINSGDHPSI